MLEQHEQPPAKSMPSNQTNATDQTSNTGQIEITDQSSIANQTDTSDRIRAIDQTDTTDPGSPHANALKQVASQALALMAEAAKIESV